VPALALPPATTRNTRPRAGPDTGAPPRSAGQPPTPVSCTTPAGTVFLPVCWGRDDHGSCPCADLPRRATCPRRSINDPSWVVLWVVAFLTAPGACALAWSWAPAYIVPALLIAKPGCGLVPLRGRHVHPTLLGRIAPEPCPSGRLLVELSSAGQNRYFCFFFLFFFVFRPSSLTSHPRTHRSSTETERTRCLLRSYGRPESTNALHLDFAYQNNPVQASPIINPAYSVAKSVPGRPACLPRLLPLGWGGGPRPP